MPLDFAGPDYLPMFSSLTAPYGPSMLVAVSRVLSPELQTCMIVRFAKTAGPYSHIVPINLRVCIAPLANSASEAADTIRLQITGKIDLRWEATACKVAELDEMENWLSPQEGSYVQIRGRGCWMPFHGKYRLAVWSFWGVLQ